MRKYIWMAFGLVGIALVSIAAAQIASQPDAKAPKPPKSKITVKPKKLNYKTVTAITSLSFSITDSGAPASGSVGGVSSPFSITSGGGGFSLNPGQSQTVTVRCAPTAKGTFKAKIAVTSNAQKGGKQSVNLVCKAKGPVPIPSPTATRTPTPTPTATPTPAVPGEVVISGGSDSPLTAEIFDPQSGQFAATGPMTCGHAHHASVSLQDGTVMVIGGFIQSISPLNLAEIFDPQTRNFTTTAKLATFREGFTATALESGEVLVAGGLASNCTFSDPCIVACKSPPAPTLSVPAELYDPIAHSFSATGTMQIPRQNHVAALLADGRVLIASGQNGAGIVAQAEIFDPSTGMFSTTGSVQTATDEWDGAVTLNTGKVLLVSGKDNSGASISDAELFDPAGNAGAGSFTTTGSLGTPRAGAAVALLENGKVLVAGGEQCSSASSCTYLASAELYDPGTGMFSTTAGPMTIDRLGATASLLLDGRVLIAGGVHCANPTTCNQITDLSSAETFDPVSTMFTGTGIGAMTNARTSHAAAILQTPK